MAAAPRKTCTPDVRPLIARGGGSFARIRATVAALRPDDAFALVSTFLPSPLIERLHAEGFHVRAEHRADGGWKPRFTRERPA